MVVPDKLNLALPIGKKLTALTAVIPIYIYTKVPPPGAVGAVALALLTHPAIRVVVVPAPTVVQILPQTSQSPAVKLMVVILVVAPFVVETAEPTSTVLETYSPTLPVAAESLVALPITPEVLENVRLVALLAPSTGVTRAGDVLPTKLTVPV